MSVFNKIKQAFGFDGENDDEILADSENRPDLKETKNVRSSASPERKSDAPAIAADGPMPDAIFEHVLDVFNKSLPDFLQKSVSTPEQRKYLYDTLSDDLKVYVNASRDLAEKQCRKHWENEKTKLQANIRELESRYRQYDDVRNDIQQKLLSTERQKRALTERVHDLEMKVMTFEAEREQFQLENKSLVNKLKVNGVHEDENKDLREEVTRLQSELTELRKKGSADSQEAGSSVSEADIREAVRKEIQSELDESKAALETAQQENRSLLEQQNNSAAQIAELERKLREAESSGLDEEAVAGQIAEIEKQMEAFQKISDEKDARIAEANRKIESLEQTLSKNRELAGAGEKLLRDEISRLRASLEESRKESERLRKQNSGNSRRGRGKSDDSSTDSEDTGITPIEDILSDTDWIVAPSALRGNQQRENTQKAQSREKHDDDRQLSLF